MLRFFIILSLLFIGFTANAQQADINLQDKVAVYERDMQRIEYYLNNISTLVARFTQTDSQGQKAQGAFYLSRPGKLRWEYDPPTPILIIAKGSLLTYYDSELDEISHISLDDTISDFLIRKKVSFSDGVSVTRFDKADGLISVTIVQNQKESDGSMTLVFSDKYAELKRMETIDAIGKKTIIEFDTLVYDKKLDNQLFNSPKTKRHKR